MGWRSATRLALWSSWCSRARRRRGFSGEVQRLPRVLGIEEEAERGPGAPGSARRTPDRTEGEVAAARVLLGWRSMWGGRKERVGWRGPGSLQITSRGGGESWGGGVDKEEGGRHMGWWSPFCKEG